jgi:hypothetical protein
MTDEAIITKYRIECETQAHNVRQESPSGKLTGFERHGVTIKLTAELPEPIANECLIELGDLLERWDARGRER